MWFTVRYSKCQGFPRLSNGFSKRLENHCAAVSLVVAATTVVATSEVLAWGGFGGGGI
jgi:hypothetical protein